MTDEILPPPTENLHTIFVNSNIDTHLAMLVSLYDTIRDVKAKIAAEHALCFQDIGEISIQAIKVRRRGFFYNLADSMYILNAFDGVKGSWFVYLDAAPMCNVKNPKGLHNKVAHEHLKHHDDAVPACILDKHQEIVFCGLSSKNSGLDGQEGHHPSIDHEHRPTILIDQEKDDIRKDDCKNLGIKDGDAMPSVTSAHKTTSSKRSKTSQQDKLLESQSQKYPVEKKRGKKLKDGMHEEHLEVCERGSKISDSEGIDASIKPATVPLEINCDGKMDVLAISSEGLLSKLGHENIKSLQNPPVNKHGKKRKSKSSKTDDIVAHLAMPSETVVIRSPQVTVDLQNSGKETYASIVLGICATEPNIEEPLPNDESDMSSTHGTASFLEVANQKEIRQEVNGEPIANVLVSLEERAEPKVSSQVFSESPTKLYCNTEELPSKLPHESTISFQNPLVEKHTKKRKRKSSKSHEEAHLVTPYGTAVVRSPQLTADSHNSGKLTNASIFSGNYLTKPSTEESLENDEKEMRTSHDTASFLEFSNKKESIPSKEIIKEPIEEHILQIKPKDQSEKHVISDQDTNVGGSLKEPAEARVSSQVASECPSKLCCSTDKFKSQSSKNIEPKDAIDQENRGLDYTSCIRDLNLGEAGYVDVMAGIPVSAEKFPYQEQATNAVSNLKGANKDCVLIEVDSKGRSKSQRSRKKSKAGSSRICESTELKRNKDHFNSDDSHFSLNDAQNESSASKAIKQVDQKANGDNNVEDFMVKISSSSKEVPNQDDVSNMNSGNPPISTLNNLSEVNAFIEQAAEIRVPSQTSSEAQAKPRRSRKKSKSEPSKIGSQENCNVVLPKFNGQVTESNDERGSDPSKLANDSSQKIELHCMDAKVKAPFPDENLSKLVKVPQVNPSESSTCELQDFSEQSNAEIILKGRVTQYEALAGPTKSKCDRKKSKKEALKAQVSSEMSEHMGICRPDESSIKFNDSFVPREGKLSPAVHEVDLPSRKSESRKRKKASGKTDTSQPYQDSPTNLVQPSSHKQQMANRLTLENDTNNDTGDATHDNGTKDSKTGIVREVKNTKQSDFGRIESGASLHNAHDKHKLDKKLQNYEPESNVQLLESGAIGNKQEKKITTDGKGTTRSLAPDHDIDNMVSKGGVWKDHNSSTISNAVGDAIGLNNFDVSRGEVMSTEVASSDSTEDIPYQKTRYRVVRKIPSRKGKKITNNSTPENSLLASSGRIFSAASVTSSESEDELYKNKAATKTALAALSTSEESESRLEEVQTKAGALKVRMNANSSGAKSDERGEISKEIDRRTKNHSRSSDTSRQKAPLSRILRSSISYKKSKLTASQSEFPDAENQPVDVVLETQPESAAP